MFLGTLKLPTLLGKHYTVTGGPFIEAPDTMVRVKMAAEIPRACDINIPTKDFSVPPAKALAEGLEAAVLNILRGRPLYVGCMAGRGRTGLFMALLAKAFGIEKPVEYVRGTYYEHAVETDEQYAFVTNYEIPPAVLKAIRTAKWVSLFSFRKNLTKKSL